jgi:hypothetical protein
MKTSTLKNKLNKLNIQFTIDNEYQLIEFTINNKSYSGSLNDNEAEVYGFCAITGYDDASQETTRRFFDNFNQVLRHSNK